MSGVAGRSGPPGNTNSSQDNRLFGSAVRRYAIQNPEKLNAVVESLFTNASTGDVQAANTIGDRLDGKPAQAITGADGGPLEIVNVPWLKDRDLAGR